MKRNTIQLLHVWLCILWLALLFSCSYSNRSKPHTSDSITQSPAKREQDSLTNRIPGVQIRKHSTTPTQIPKSSSNRDSANKDSNTVSNEVAKGYAIVYCPTKLIIHVPAILNAEITKEELEAAYATFATRLQQQNPDKNAQAIAKDIRGDSIDVYEKMRVAIEFDSSEFKQISGNDNALQAFANRKTLDWQWVIKPLESTRKSIIIFRFYGTDAASGEETIILEKTIDISVQVDARSFVEKWSDFLLDDPKTTITAILIPLISFLGGFISGKKKKTASA